MYFNMYGCDGWGDYAGATGDTDCGPLSTWPSACGCGSGVVGAMPEKHPYAVSDNSGRQPLPCLTALHHTCWLARCRGQ